MVSAEEWFTFIEHAASGLVKGIENGQANAERWAQDIERSNSKFYRAARGNEEYREISRKIAAEVIALKKASTPPRKLVCAALILGIIEDAKKHRELAKALETDELIREALKKGY